MEKAENIMNNNLKKNAFEKLKNFNKINIITKFNLLQKYFKKDNLEEKEKENTEDKKENQIEDKLNNNDNEPIKDILIRKNILFKLKKEDDKTENYKKEDNKKEDEKKEDNKNEDDKKEESRKKRISHRKSPKKNSLRKKKSKKKNLKKAFDKWKRYSFSSDTKDDLINKYKNKVLQDLLKVYKKNKKNSLLRNYFDKWKNKEQVKEEEEEEKEILKYKKKPKISDNKDIIEEDKEQEFIKENDNDTFRPVYILSKKNLYNNVLLNQNPNIDESIHESYDSNIINTNNLNKNNAPYIKKYGQRNFNKKNKNISNNQNDKEYEQASDDTSSNEGSILSGISLIQKKEEIKEPRNYTSQSYFIDTNNKKDITQNEIYKINKIPNVMKGDFDNFIENNPNILCNKNPRIQITSSTYDIDELNNVDNNKYDINNKIIQKCDYDLYANQKSKSKRDKWYSMSIPLNKAYKYNNKNEMIKKNENDRINYKLQEMNASQFYKSPNRRIYKNKFEDKFIIPGKNRRNMNKSLSPFNRYNRNNEINNKIEFDRNNKWQKSNINY